MDISVRRSFEDARASPLEAEARLPSTERGGVPTGGEIRLVHCPERDFRVIEIEVAGGPEDRVDHLMGSALHAREQGIVAAVRPGVFNELGTHVSRARITVVAVIPIRQCPILVRAAERLDRFPADRFKAAEITAVPGEEVPAAVLALAPYVALVRRMLLARLF